MEVCQFLDVCSVAAVAASCAWANGNEYYYQPGCLMRWRVSIFRCEMQMQLFKIVMNDVGPACMQNKVFPSRMLRVAQVAWTWLEDFPAAFFSQCDNDCHRRYLVMALIRCAALHKLTREQQLEVLKRVGTNLDPAYDHKIDNVVMAYVRRMRYGTESRRPLIPMTASRSLPEC